MSTFVAVPRHPSLLGRAALITVPSMLLLGSLSGRYAGAADGGPWFEGLLKPVFFPPGWAFGIAWSILYALMGLALAVVLNARAPGRGFALALFAVQVALNLAWAPLFFRFHQIGASVALIGVLFVVVLLTIWRFGAVRRVAGWLLVPYLLWLAFASVLDAQTWRLNPGGSRFVENRPITVPLAQE